MKIKALLFVLVCCLYVSKAFCAIIIHMKIDGYNGPSTDPNYENYYDITQTSQIDTGCFATPNCPGIAGDFIFQIPLGTFSVPAQIVLTQSSFLPTVDIVYSQAGGKQLAFYQMHLTGVRITSISQSAEENVIETMSFTFQSVSWKFTPYNNGIAGPSTTGCWNRASNSCTIPTFPF